MFVTLSITLIKLDQIQLTDQDQLSVGQIKDKELQFWGGVLLYLRIISFGQSTNAPMSTQESVLEIDLGLSYQIVSRQIIVIKYLNF